MTKAESVVLEDENMKVKAMRGREGKNVVKVVGWKEEKFSSTEKGFVVGGLVATS